MKHHATTTLTLTAVARELALELCVAIVIATRRGLIEGARCCSPHRVMLGRIARHCHHGRVGVAHVADRGWTCLAIQQGRGRVLTASARDVHRREQCSRSVHSMI